MYIFISVFYFIFNDRLYTPVAATTMPATTTIRRQRFIVRFDSISVFLVSFFFFFFLIILRVLVAAEVFLPIIFFVNWLGSHAARVSRRRRRNELADRLPPSSSLPFAVSFLVALTVYHLLSLSVSLVNAHYLTAAV